MNLLSAIEIEPATPATHSVIWMHGLGADGNDFVPIVRELSLPKQIAIRFIFPHAPTRPVTINGGYVMRAWYDIAEPDTFRREDETGLRESQRAIETLIAREVERGILSKNIVLAGFSQGGAMALQTGLRYPHKLAGIMVLSGYLPLAPTLPGEAHTANAATPIFMAHGRNDAVIPLPIATASKQRLTAAGYEVEWHEYRMEHTVCEEEIADISNFFRRQMSLA